MQSAHSVALSEEGVRAGPVRFRLRFTGSIPKPDTHTQRGSKKRKKRPAHPNASFATMTKVVKFIRTASQPQFAFGERQTDCIWYLSFPGVLSRVGAHLLQKEPALYSTLCSGCLQPGKSPSPGCLCWCCKYLFTAMRAGNGGTIHLAVRATG